MFCTFAKTDDLTAEWKGEVCKTTLVTFKAPFLAQAKIFIFSITV